jgi:hypothetical protein
MERFPSHLLLEEKAPLRSSRHSWRVHESSDWE